MSTVTPQLRAAIMAALYHHECRSNPAIAYRLSFALVGNLGASFGPLQADCHANPSALAAIEQICRGAKMPIAQLGRVLGTLRRPLPHGWPGSADELAAINAAIAAPAGRAIVDQFMQTILDGLVEHLEGCIRAAAERGSAITPAALIGMAIWINQDGPPTDLLTWLRGGAVDLGGQPVPALARGAPADQQAWISYFGRIPFVRQHSNQMQPMLDAITVGMKALGHATSASCTTVV